MARTVPSIETLQEASVPSKSPEEKARESWQRNVFSHVIKADDARWRSHVFVHIIDSERRLSIRLELERQIDELRIEKENEIERKRVAQVRQEEREKKLKAREEKFNAMREGRASAADDDDCASVVSSVRRRRRGRKSVAKSTTPLKSQEEQI